MNQKFLNTLMDICFTIFIIELMLGFNGRLLVLGNIPIRQILFGVVVTVLTIKVFIVIRDSRYHRKDNKYTSKTNNNNLINTYFSKLDKILALFLGLNLIWVFVIPSFTGTPFRISIKEVLCVNVILLYFPLVILMKSNLLNWQKYKTIIKGSILALGIIHIIFYIGEVVVGDATFALSVFKGIEKLTSEHTVRPIVMMPESYIRIIYPASIFLIMTFYFTINSKQNINNTALTFLGTFALCTTLTKSLFLGVLGGVILYYSIIAYKKVKDKNTLQISRVNKFISTILISCIVLNFVVFDNYIFMRLTKPFAIATDKSQEKSQKVIESDIATEDVINDMKEHAGTERANLTRIKQIQQLIDKWKQKPILGWGYGSSIQQYTANGNDTPYSYEMVGIALLMKIGLVGILIWLSFFCYVIWYILKRLTPKTYNALAIVYLLTALGISTQFNPFLFNSSGMSIILFCFLEMKIIELENDKIAGEKWTYQ